MVDPSTGNVFAISGNGLTMSLNKDGKLLWERSLAEEYGMWTTHGGRMSTPIIDGDKMIVSGLVFGWGQTAAPAHRFIALDKTNGQTIWVSAPGGPADGHDLREPVRRGRERRPDVLLGRQRRRDARAEDRDRRAGVALGRQQARPEYRRALMIGSDVIVTHSEENIASSEMGMIAAVPAASKGTLTDKDARWIVRDVQAGYGSPVSDGERIYLVDNGGILFAFDVKTGKQLWTEKLGTIQKSSPVLADGKLYVGTENGKFYIIRPHADKAEVLDSDQLGTEENPEAIIARASRRARPRLRRHDGARCMRSGRRAQRRSAAAAAPASSSPAAPAGTRCW